MTGPLPLALALGLTLGLGLWLLVSIAPRLSRPTLASRIAPHVVDVSPQARELLERRTADPLPVFGVLLGPVVGRVVRLAAALAASAETTETRLRQAGLTVTLESYRARQLAWAGASASLGVVLSLALSRAQSVPLAAHVALVVMVAAAGFFGRDYLLQRQAAARMARMQAELPTVLEFLTLSLSAGEGILDALRRVSRISRGELAAEIGTVIGAVATGLPLAESLTSLSRKLQLPSLTRAIEQLTGALERGTPLADVLRAQAHDSRDEAKRELIELSGKKEVAMLVPLVFLILPTTIAFAIFPGVFVLQLGF